MFEDSGQKNCAESSTQFPNPGFFYGVISLFIVEEATPISVLCIEVPTPEAVSPVRLLR
jgi:hypothetical protein